MSKLKNFDGSVQIISGLIPKNNNDFPLMEAHSILVDENGTRLDDVLGGLGDGAVCEHNYIMLKELDKDPTNCTTWQDICYCTKCEAVKARRLYKNHTWLEANCEYPKRCEQCSTTEGEKLGHIWSEWAWDKATEKEKRTCPRCETDEYRSTYYTYNELDDGTYSISKINVTVEGNVEIPSTYMGKDITRIEAEAFKNQKGITNIVVPDSVKSIGLGAFKGCSGVTNITIPFVGEQKDGGGNKLFGYIFGAEEFKDDNWILQNAYIPKDLKTVTITGGTTIGQHAFNTCSYIQKIYLPNTLTTLDGQAFRDCRNITYIGKVEDETDSTNGVVIPDSVTSIGGGAFYNCSKIKSFTIPDSVTYIGGDVLVGTAFYENKNNWSSSNLYVNNHLIKAKETTNNSYSLIIRDGTRTIAGQALMQTNVSNVTIPNSVVSIGDEAFYDCPKLIGVTIPDSVTHIYSNTFAYCSNITSVELGNSVAEIGPSAFERCGKLKTINLPDSVTYIGGYAFYASGLEHITIPKNCSYIGSDAFTYCISSPIEVASGNEWYHSENGSLIETKTGKVIHSAYGYIPTTASSIGSGAVYGKTYSAPIKIPSNITTIEPQAFGGVEGGMTVYVEKLEKPEGWADDWCDETVTVIWGYTDKDTCEHVWGAWEIDSKPTCTRMGRATSTCTICGKISTRKLAPFGHVESDWIIDVEPTTDTEGSKHKVCLTCGEITQVESIPKLDTSIYLLTEDGDYLTDEQGNKLIIEGD